jgi:hypothetical protein
MSKRCTAVSTGIQEGKHSTHVSSSIADDRLDKSRKRGNMPTQSSDSTISSQDVQPPGACHFFKIPLEIRDEIYGMLMKTQYCVHIGSEDSFAFNFATQIFLANKQISREARSVFFEGIDFVILKTIGLYLPKESLLGFKFLTEDQITRPVLRVEVAVAEQVRPARSGRNEFTLVTTVEGLQPFIIALWRLKEINVPSRVTNVICHADLGLSLSLDVKATRGSQILSNSLLKPWDRLHGIRQLALTGNISSSMYTHLQDNILRGPFPEEVVMNLIQYYASGQKKMKQNYYGSAKWWLLLFDEYWRYLGGCRRNHLPEQHSMRDINNLAWKAAWAECQPMYFQGKLSLIKMYLQELRFKQAQKHAEYARWDWTWPLIEPQYTVTPILCAKFLLCEGLSYIALGDTRTGIDCLTFSASSLLNTRRSWTIEIRNNLAEDLQRTVNAELLRHKFVRRCEWHSKREPSWPWAWQGDGGSLSFWDWLDVPESHRVRWNGTKWYTFDPPA